MDDELLLAPLQSYTDHHFRNAYQQVFGSVDAFYAPYLKMSHDGTIKEGPKLDVLPENNPYFPVIPQIMACSADDFLVMAKYLTDLGYEEMNWNLGCPYPMVAKRDLGSGILDKPEKIFEILDAVLPKMNAELGIKMRMGYESTEDILSLLPRLNDYPLTEIIIHARYGKQLYTGGCDHKRFQECIQLTDHHLVYNGDINTVEEFRHLKTLFPETSSWMLGRGAVSNPFLFEMITEDNPDFPSDRSERFGNFLELLLDSHLSNNKNEGNALIKMKSYWEYFADSFEDGVDYYRKIRKTKKLSEYEAEVEEILSNL